jgi:hypothetical protein
LRRPGAQRVDSERSLIVSNTQQSGWAGWAVFAGVVLIIVGAINAIFGLTGIIGPDNALYANADSGNIWLFDVSAWGWWHLIVGLVLILVGVFVTRGATWARTIAVIIASLNAISQLATLPYQPLLALAIIGLDVVIIYAHDVHGKELRRS